MSPLEMRFLEYLKSRNLVFTDTSSQWWLLQEFEFTTKEKYKFDFAFPHLRLAFEINGQIFHKGGHSSGTGLERDYRKLNLAQSLGWTVIQLSSNMIKDEVYIDNIINQFLETKGLLL